MSGLFRTFLKSIEHSTNPLTIYCRLRDYGFSKRTAKNIGKTYEKFIYPVFRCIYSCAKIDVTELSDELHFPDMD